MASDISFTMFLTFVYVESGDVVLEMACSFSISALLLFHTISCSSFRLPTEPTSSSPVSANFSIRILVTLTFIVFFIARFSACLPNHTCTEFLTALIGFIAVVAALEASVSNSLPTLGRAEGNFDSHSTSISAQP